MAEATKIDGSVSGSVAAPEKIEAKPVPMPVPVEVKADPPKPKPTIVEEKVYKLNMRRPDGQLRGEVSKATLMTVAAQYGDLIRSIPSTRFANMDEIAKLVWDAEQRSYMKGHPRTRKQIEDGVRHMVAHGVIIER